MQQVAIAALIWALTLVSVNQDVVIDLQVLDTGERIEVIRADVEQVQQQINVSFDIKTVYASDFEPGISPITWIVPYKDTATFGLHVREQFLKEASPLLLKHVVRHELCHLLNGDFEGLGSSTEDEAFVMEQKVEECVQKLVGEEVYATYVDAYQRWNPVSFELRDSRLRILSTMPGENIKN